MTIYVEFDENVENPFDFDIDLLVKQVAEQVLESEGCPYEACINVLVTDNAGIREFNREYREIDRETDVLSFPNLDFEQAGSFEIPEDREADYFDPDSGELVLGDIILSADKIKEQAENYGHSEKREFAFLVAHSMFHLCGYDHMTEEDAASMEKKQEAALQALGITRD
ncbi:MAG: rRNA maturation RNase YbeY [Lachnospiraceae bacterium]|nr:rRNA maturation RNase YbeY [Lachnospiraceae bacterium]